MPRSTPPRTRSFATKKASAAPETTTSSAASQPGQGASQAEATMDKREAEEAGKGKKAKKKKKKNRGEQRATQDTHLQPHGQPLTLLPQPSSFEVDGVLNVVEPTLRNIFKTQVHAQAADCSFAAASPWRGFMTKQLEVMRSIVAMYERRGVQALSRYQAYALESARFAVEELRRMEREDEEREKRGRSGTDVAQRAEGSNGGGGSG